MTTAALLPELLKLGRNDRLLLADALLRSLHTQEAESPAQFNAELDRRLAHMQAHPELAVSWEDLNQELEKM